MLAMHMRIPVNFIDQLKQHTCPKTTDNRRWMGIILDKIINSHMCLHTKLIKRPYNIVYRYHVMHLAAAVHISCHGF